MTNVCMNQSACKKTVPLLFICDGRRVEDQFVNEIMTRESHERNNTCDYNYYDGYAHQGLLQVVNIDKR